MNRHGVQGNPDVAPLYDTPEMRGRVDRYRYKLDLAKQSRRRYCAVIRPKWGKGQRKMVKEIKITVESISIAQARLDVEAIFKRYWPGAAIDELTLTAVIVSSDPLPFGRTFK